MINKVEICYLCGAEIVEDFSKDHIPPKQFYATKLRRIHNPNLFTVPVHIECNQDYQKDEDYFVNSLVPLCNKTYSGSALLKDIERSIKKRPQSKRLALMIYKEFDTRPSGLILPPGVVVKRYDGKRIRNIIWKITRGLFFKEYNKVLPQATPKLIVIINPGKKPPEYFLLLSDVDFKGDYPGVFDYKFKVLEEVNNFHFWAMLFWDNIIVFSMFHDPECNCEQCKEISFNQNY